MLNSSFLVLALMPLYLFLSTRIVLDLGMTQILTWVRPG